MAGGTLLRALRGADLVELMDDGLLSTEVPPCSALYFWKLDLAAVDVRSLDAAAGLAWLQLLSATPVGRTRAARIGHYLRLENLRLSAGPLPATKSASLKTFLAKSGNRNWMHRFLEELGQHAPALYVGETGDLPARIKQHMSGASDFGRMVKDSEDLDWTRLQLQYCSLGPPSQEGSSTRTALEYFATTVTIAGYTTRPG